MDEPLRAIELGCGCGIAGIAVAACFPNSKVLLTDGDRRAVDFARQNAKHNALESRVATSELAWQLDMDVTSFCRLIGGPPHLILAADVVYREETFPALVSTLARLCDAGGRISEGATTPSSKQPMKRAVSSPPEVLLAYRPRVDDVHFFHMLRLEFELEVAVPPKEAGALLLSALAPRGVRARGDDNVASDDDRVSMKPPPPRSMAAADAAAAGRHSRSMIFRLRRREDRVPEIEF